MLGSQYSNGAGVLTIGAVSTLIVIVTVEAHCPTDGVKVYVVVVVLFNIGNQLPETPFVDVVGNGDKTDPEHIGATALNIGTIGTLLTTMVIVVELAHKPVVGVNVYVVVEVLFNAGDQVPVIPFVDVVGNVFIVAPEHIGATAVKVGVILGLTVIVSVVEVAHKPVVGVNV